MHAIKYLIPHNRQPHYKLHHTLQFRALEWLLVLDLGLDIVSLDLDLDLDNLDLGLDVVNLIKCACETSNLPLA